MSTTTVATITALILPLQVHTANTGGDRRGRVSRHSERPLYLVGCGTDDADHGSEIKS